MSRFEDSSSIRRGESFERATYRTKNSRSHSICHERAQKNSKHFTLDALTIFVANRAVNFARFEETIEAHVEEVRFLADRKANTLFIHESTDD